MAGRLGRIVGLAAILLVLLRLGRVLETVVDTPDWRLLVPVAVVGGALVTWATAPFRPGTRLLAHGVGLMLMILRIVAPETLDQGFLPGDGTAEALVDEVSYAIEILRFGAPPVLAVDALVALTAMATWCLGAGWAWSVSGGPAGAGTVPALGFYLYLAVVDRAPAATRWNLAFAVVAALSLVATSGVVPPGAGRLRSTDHRPLPRWQVAPALAAAGVLVTVGLGGSGAVASVMPEGGAVAWRSPGGEGTGVGGSGFAGSRFADLRQSIVSRSDEPVFVASVSSTPTGPAAYWRLLTLDVYDGTRWSAGDAGFRDFAEPSTDGEDLVRQTIRVGSLRDDRLPSLFRPVTLASEDRVLRSGVSVGADGTIGLSALTDEDLTYRVDSAVPGVDIAALASTDTGLSPLFAEAEEQGRISISATDSAPVEEPPGLGGFLALPTDLDPALEDVARETTAGATTDFERALLLEGFLRGFTYSTNVSTGHTTLDMVDWLTEADSVNFRTGYCEQFAATMGVLARTLGIPSRVVIGFTPGEQVDTSDGLLTVVRERNAHAWVELWLEGQGWVAFDPTPRGDVATSSMVNMVGFDPGEIDLAANDPGIPDPADQPQPGDLSFLPGTDLGPGGGVAPGTALPRWLAVAGLVCLAAAGIPIWKRRRSRRRRRHAAGGDMTAVWAEITDRLVDLGDGPMAHQTPIEFAAGLSPRLAPMAHAYASALYGERRIANAASHLHVAEAWLEDAYDRRQRTLAAFNPRSLR